MKILLLKIISRMESEKNHKTQWQVTKKFQLTSLSKVTYENFVANFFITDRLKMSNKTRKWVICNQTV